MNLARQTLHIAKVFGIRYATKRIWHAFRSRTVDLFRTLNHKRRTRHITSDTVEVLCLGKTFEIKLTDLGLHRDLYADRIREPVATSLMLAHAKPGDVFLDIGANIGYYTLLLADKCRTVISLEPDEANFSALARHVELNGLDNVKTFHLAASDNSEDVYLRRSAKSNWHRALKTMEPHDDVPKSTKAVSVDDFCNSLDVIPTVMKLDVEGFEQYVLPGAKNTLKSIRVLFFELHSTHISLSKTNELLDQVFDAGLRLHKIIRYDRPGMWIEEPIHRIEDIRRGDFGIYELFFVRS